MLEKVLDEAIAFSRRSLARIGVDPAPLEASGKALVALDNDAFESALREFSAAAEGYYSASDSDFGALVLEQAAENCEDAERKKKLLLEAQSRAATYASYATSGGEGTARMLDVNRLLAKLAALGVSY